MLNASLKSYKIFVKESEINLSENKKTKEDKLFNTKITGDEAKKIYDDIINEISEKKEPDLSIVKQEKITTPKKNNNNLSSSSVELNPNKILKAVEQGDISYLKKNLHKENVNRIFDNYGWSPLMCAACCGNESIVEYLLKLGADKQYKTNSGLTALQLARKNNFINVVVLLESDCLNKNIDTADNQSNRYDSFYCEVCKKNYQGISLKEHQASIAHNLNNNPELPPPFYGLSKQNRGYKIMLNNGWNDKNGLGPYGSGLKYPVKTILKRDRRGIGRKPYDKPKITHFKSFDINAVTHIKQKSILQTSRPLNKKDRKKILDKDRRKERDLRRELS